MVPGRPVHVNAGSACLPCAKADHGAPLRLRRNLHHKASFESFDLTPRRDIMSWDVRPCSDTAEQRDAMSAIWHYFGRSAPRDDQMASLAQVMPPERMHATWDDGRIVAGAGV